MSIQIDTHETLLIARGTDGTTAFITRDRTTKVLGLRVHLPSGDKIVVVDAPNNFSELCDIVRQMFKATNEPDMFYPPENLTATEFLEWMRKNNLVLMEGEQFVRAVKIIAELDAVAEKHSTAILVIKFPRQVGYILANDTNSNKKSALAEAFNLGGTPLGIVGLKQKSGNVYFYASLLAERETDKETLLCCKRALIT